PPLTHVRPTTFAQIERLVASGGSVIADTLLPMHVIEPGTGAPVSSNGEARDFARFFGVDPGMLLERFQAGEAGPFDVRYGTGPDGSGNVIVFTGPGLSAETATKVDRRALAGEGMSSPGARAGQEARDGLKAALDRCITPDVTISEPDVFYLHRVKDGHDVYFLANTMQEDRGRVEVTFERVGRPELWNPNTGATEPIHVYDVRDGRLVLWLDFPPTEAHVVVIRGGPSTGSGQALDGAPHVTETNLDAVTMEGGTVVGYAEGGEEAFAVVGRQRRIGAARQRLAPIELPERYAFRTEEPNALLIGDFKMRMFEGDAAGDGWESADFDDAGWLDVTNGAWEMQLPAERDEATYPV